MNQQGFIGRLWVQECTVQGAVKNDTIDAFNDPWKLPQNSIGLAAVAAVAVSDLEEIKGVDADAISTKSTRWATWKET